jgi:peroxiredoxin
VKEFKSEFDRRGVAIAVVSFAETSRLAQYQELHQWPFTILADPGRKAYQAFNLRRLSLFRVFSPATLKRYFQLLRRGAKQKRYDGADIFQAGGDFIIDRRGNVLFAHRSKDPADRPSPGKLLVEMDRIRSSTAA